MATFKEETEYDKIEVVTKFKHLQIRKVTIVKKDDVVIAKNFERSTLNCGYLNDKDELVDTDLSKEPTEISSIATAVWTSDVKAAWKAKLIADKSKS
tara:strand:+ start:807 stop:1097 length:291 start_codon:yes stop_codon:yes gene_type:complete